MKKIAGIHVNNLYTRIIFYRTYMNRKIKDVSDISTSDIIV